MDVYRAHGSDRHERDDESDDDESDDDDDDEGDGANLASSADAVDGAMVDATGAMDGELMNGCGGRGKTRVEARATSGDRHQQMLMVDAPPRPPPPRAIIM